MRSFIAIEMQNEEIGEIQAQLREANAKIKFVEPENLHLTLKFLGEVREDLIDEIHEVMKRSFEDFGKFEVHLKGVGVFPNLRYIRVIWVGIEKNKETISEMQKALDRNIAELGFERERRFDPHLTIGRVKSAKNRDKLVEMIRGMEDIDIGDIAIDRVELKKSVLTPKGPIYTTVREVRL